MPKIERVISSCQRCRYFWITDPNEPNPKFRQFECIHPFTFGKEIHKPEQIAGFCPLPDAPDYRT